MQSVMAGYAIETGVVCVFSCQQIIDHVVYKGCSGGRIPLAYGFMNVFGLATEKDDPKSQFPGQGRMNVPIALTLSDFKVIDPTERDFMRALQVSPIAVSLNVTSAATKRARFLCTCWIWQNRRWDKILEANEYVGEGLGRWRLLLLNEGHVKSSRRAWHHGVRSIQACPEQLTL